jgi:glycosyltransferase involved in cell wall biosynthesis
MKASLVITTKNRRDDLRRAIASAVRQTEPLEIIVLDDGSSDGTADMVSQEFPEVRLVRSATSNGLVAQRNLGAVLSSGDLIFSIDDDAEFSTPNVVAQTIGDFSNSRIGAIAIPYVEPKKSDRCFQCAPDTNGIWVTASFRGTAYAVKRDVFNRVGGFRTDIVHQGEELDFCIRLLAKGWFVRLGTGDAILHYEALRRDWARTDFYGRRNDILFAWRNVPMPYLPVHLVGTTLKGLGAAFNSGRSTHMLRGIGSAYGDIIFKTYACSPVPKRAYRLHRILRKYGPQTLQEVVDLL